MLFEMEEIGSVVWKRFGFYKQSIFKLFINLKFFYLDAVQSYFEEVV
jgi:hypothetical protein